MSILFEQNPFAVQLAHCKGGYYREIAYKPHSGESKLQVIRIRKAPLKSERDVELLLDAYRNRPGYFVSVYSFALINSDGIVAESAKIDRLYLDFDDIDNPDIARVQCILALKALNKHNIFSHVYYSGQKGFALYIEFTTVDISNTCKKEVIARAFDIIKETIETEYENFFGTAIPSTHTGFRYELTTLDKQIRGDINRISRLPNTKHKSGRYCIPLSPGELRRPMSEIIALAQTPKDVNLSSIIAKCVLRNITLPILFKNLEKLILYERSTSKQDIEAQQRKVRVLDADHKEVVVDIKKWCFNHGISLKPKNGINDKWKRTTESGKIIKGTLYLLNECPFNNDHKDASIVQMESGGIAFHCFHNSCKNRTWSDLKKKVE